MVSKGEKQAMQNLFRACHHCRSWVSSVRFGYRCVVVMLLTHADMLRDPKPFLVFSVFPNGSAAFSLRHFGNYPFSSNFCSGLVLSVPFDC